MIKDKNVIAALLRFALSNYDTIDCVKEKPGSHGKKRRTNFLSLIEKLESDTGTLDNLKDVCSFYKRERNVRVSIQRLPSRIEEVLYLIFQISMPSPIKSDRSTISGLAGALRIVEQQERRRIKLDQSISNFLQEGIELSERKNNMHVHTP